MARILMVSKGGYGDMYPMFAIAQRLRDRGHEISVAADGRWEAATRSLKLPLIRLDRPDVSGDPGWRDGIAAPAPAILAAECETLLAAAAGHALILGGQIGYTAAMVSRRLRIPWVFCAPSPLAMPSRLEPPLFPYLHRLQALTLEYPWTQRPYIALARLISRLVTYPVAIQQWRWGLNSRGNPRFEGLYSDRLNLMLASPMLVRPAADWPPNTVITGVAWFEPEYMRNEANSRALSLFLASGAPPVVFAAGGPARSRPGRFFTEGIRACKLLGLRAVVVAANRFLADLPRSPDVLISGFLPFSELFASAAAVVHSGGIGTCAWSVRCAIPSLLVPSSGDHYDNARRMQQQRLAHVMSEGEYSAERIAARLERLLADRELQQSLALHRSRMAAEDGAGLACTAIESVLGETGSQANHDRSALGAASLNRLE